jgi:hypothetical protein
MTFIYERKARHSDSSEGARMGRDVGIMGFGMDGPHITKEAGRRVRCSIISTASRDVWHFGGAPASMGTVGVSEGSRLK